jgi:hypothetical protein
MNISNKTTIISRVIHKEQKQLVLTFTLEEIETLTTLGDTSHFDRVKFLESRSEITKDKANACSKLLAEIYFAAAEFKKVFINQ